MDFTIRLLESPDMPHINRLFIETVHTINARDYSKEQLAVWAPLDRSASYWKEAFKDHVVYVAEHNKNIIGFGDITNDGCIDHLFVHKDYQGYGVAGALLAKLEEVAHNLRFKEIYTEASITAQPFFEKKGFMLTRKQEKHYKGLTFVNYIMHKKFTS